MPRTPTFAQRERLLFILSLRQIDAPTDDLRVAYRRLEKAITNRVNIVPDTTILDWLEAEMRILRRHGADKGETGATLLGQAVEFCGTLRA